MRNSLVDPTPRPDATAGHRAAILSPGLWLVFLLATGLVAGCEVSPRREAPIDYRGLIANTTPAAWQAPGLWEFRVTSEDKTIGEVLLYLTNDLVGEGSCVDRNWRKAIVVSDNLALDYDIPKAAAYSISGPWLTVNLTAESCSVGHAFVGTIDDSGATGHFNVSHTFGGENIGRFVARPAENSAKESEQ